MLLEEKVLVWTPHTDLKGGKGVVFLSKEQEKDSTTTVSYIWIPPHRSIGLHKNEDYEETLIVEEGGLMKVNGKYYDEYTCKKGESYDCLNDTNKDMYIRSTKTIC